MRDFRNEIRPTRYAWEKLSDAQVTVLQFLEGMTDEERRDVFYFFCTYCGSTDQNCTCERND